MSGLPVPESVPDRAGDLAERTAGVDGPAVNVRVAPVDGGFDPASVELGEGGYEGENAGDLGRLAAAVDAVERADAPGTARLHYPDPDPGAEGPWLVVEPLSGRLSTVHAGRGRLVVSLTHLPPGVDAGLRAIRERLCDLLDAVRPDHERYPVERDEEGVFTRGMTTLSLAGVDTDERGGDEVTVRFDVSTTPATRADEVESLVSDLACVREGRYGTVAELVRADPPRSLLRAAEAATERAVGDWEYEWFPEPTEFSRLPAGSKLALGTGRPGAASFGNEAYERCRAMLAGTVERFGGASEYEDRSGGDG